MPRGAIVVMVIDVVMGSDGSEGKGWIIEFTKKD